MRARAIFLLVLSFFSFILVVSFEVLFPLRGDGSNRRDGVQQRQIQQQQQQQKNVPMRRALGPLYAAGNSTHWFGPLHSAPAQGYLIFCNAWAQWNNHRRQILDAVAVARVLNRILVIPEMQYSNLSPSAFEFFDRESMAQLGPMMTWVEFHARFPNAEAIMLTPKPWGKQVSDAGVKTLRNMGLKLKGKPIEYPASTSYGGVETTAFWDEYQSLRSEPYVAFAYLFSQNRFEGELRLFAFIRSKMQAGKVYNSIADRFVRDVRAKYRRFVSAHVRRGDHEAFCKGNLDCYPTITMMANRINGIVRAKQAGAVFLSHNAPSEEIRQLRDKITVPLITFDPASDPEAQQLLQQMSGDRRVLMLIDVLIAARADFFIGNNWSTLTANIMEERSVLGHDPRSFVYWGDDARPLWYGRENEKRPETCLCGESNPRIPYDWSSLQTLVPA